MTNEQPKNTGADPRRDAAVALSGRIKRAKRPGRPGKPSGVQPTEIIPPENNAGRAAGDAPPAGGGAGGPGVDLAGILNLRCMDAINGYRNVGYFLTGHAHWKAISAERVEAGARTMVDLIARMPEAAQIALVNSLCYTAIIAVAGEIFVAPAVVSLQINRAAKAKAKADAEKKEKEGDAQADEPKK